MLTNRRTEHRKAMAVSKKEFLILYDFEDEKDVVNVLEKALAEGMAYPMLAIDSVL